MVENELSATMRDYLAEVYRLAERSGKGSDFVGTSTLAELLDVSAPAVNRMVTKLKEQGLLNHEPYQGIRLTPSGAREALRYLRRHRIVEAFLVNVMKFGWHEVHREADRISKAATDVLVERMYEMAGRPTQCPHGELIPDETGNVPARDDILLVNAPVKVDLTITRVHTREPDRLEYLAALHLTPGMPVQVLTFAPFNGPIQLKLGSEYRIIGHNLAETIRVQPQM